MRTDSINLSDEAINASREIISNDFGSEYLPDSARHYKGKVKNAQEAHEAIRPAGRKFKKVTYFGLTAQLLTKKEETFNARLLNIDSKRIAKGQDFNQETGELKKDGLIALSKSQAKALVEEIDSGPWVVSNIEEKPKTSNPKPPFTTSTLQQEASRKLKFNTRKTMSTAQKLYEAGLITYMRTCLLYTSPSPRD